MNVQSSLRGSAITHRKPGLRARIGARFGQRLLDRIDAGLTEGVLEVVAPDGSYRVLGGRGDGPQARLTINRWRALLRMARSGSVGGYEGWERREWASDDLVAVFDLFMRNRRGLSTATRAHGLKRLILHLAHARKRNDRSGASRNIAAHYDLGNDFYASWLDPSMSYSSALFGDEGARRSLSLEAAQQAKIDAMIARMALSTPGHILEIGCGWGHFARACAARGHQVTAITLSPAQRAWAMTHRADGEIEPDVQLCDYRDVTGQYDAIASVEMVEAVGQDYWRDYLSTIWQRLRPGGRAAIQYITIDDDVFDAYAASQDFIQAYIFPGGVLLSERRFRALAEEAGFGWDAPHHFALDYAETLKRWRDRFDAAVEEGRLPAGFDERFVRLWRFYLMYCEGGFRSGGISVAQVTLVKPGLR